MMSPRNVREEIAELRDLKPLELGPAIDRISRRLVEEAALWNAVERYEIEKDEL